MGKSLAENHEERQGKVGVLGQKSQIPDFFARRARKENSAFLTAKRKSLGNEEQRSIFLR